MQTLRLDLQIEGFTDTVSIEAFAPYEHGLEISYNGRVIRDYIHPWIWLNYFTNKIWAISTLYINLIVKKL